MLVAAGADKRSTDELNTIPFDHICEGKKRSARRKPERRSLNSYVLELLQLFCLFAATNSCAARCSFFCRQTFVAVQLIAL